MDSLLACFRGRKDPVPGRHEVPAPPSRPAPSVDELLAELRVRSETQRHSGFKQLALHRLPALERAGAARV